MLHCQAKGEKIGKGPRMNNKRPRLNEELSYEAKVPKDPSASQTEEAGTLSNCLSSMTTRAPTFKLS